MCWRSGMALTSFLPRVPAAYCGHHNGEPWRHTSRVDYDVNIAYACHAPCTVHALPSSAAVPGDGGSAAAVHAAWHVLQHAYHGEHRDVWLPSLPHVPVTCVCVYVPWRVVWLTGCRGGEPALSTTPRRAIHEARVVRRIRLAPHPIECHACTWASTRRSQSLPPVPSRVCAPLCGRVARQASLTTFFRTLCKHKGEPRNRALQWTTTVVAANTGRTMTRPDQSRISRYTALPGRCHQRRPLMRVPLCCVPLCVGGCQRCHVPEPGRHAAKPV